jgi:hypothetical protein
MAEKSAASRFRLHSRPALDQPWNYPAIVEDICSYNLLLNLTFPSLTISGNSHRISIMASRPSHSRTVSTNLGSGSPQRPLEGKVGIVTGASRGKSAQNMTPLYMLTPQESASRLPATSPARDAASSSTTRPTHPRRRPKISPPNCRPSMASKRSLYRPAWAQRTAQSTSSR